MPKRETREMREKKVKPLITQNIKAGTRKNTYKILHITPHFKALIKLSERQQQQINKSNQNTA